MTKEEAAPCTCGGLDRSILGSEPHAWGCPAHCDAGTPGYPDGPEREEAAP